MGRGQTDFGIPCISLNRTAPSGKVSLLASTDTHQLANLLLGIQAVRISAPVAYILLYAALYAAFGVASPFWPRFFETRALSPQEIGIVLAAGMLTRLLAGPMVGMLADRAGSLRFALAICTALAAASAAALLWAHSFALLLFITVIQAASLAPTTSLADALSVNAARPRLAGKEFEYGWIRGSASLAFIIGTLTVGQLISEPMLRLSFG
jgi:PPP family 3-phenylpropionic acid transporter